MKQGTFLTNAELIAQLSLRDDLTELEHDLLDRLMRAQDEIDRFEAYQSTDKAAVAVSDNAPS